MTEVTLSQPKGPMTLNDADLDHVSGGWDTGGGVVTATLKGGNPPAVYNIVTNKAPDVVVGVGQFGGPGGTLPP